MYAAKAFAIVDSRIPYYLSLIGVTDFVQKSVIAVNDFLK